MKKLAGVLGLVVLLLASIVLLRAAFLTSRQLAVGPLRGATVDPPALAGRLAAAVRFRTVSHQGREDLDDEAFLGLHRHLAEAFPLVHRRLEREVVQTYSLLYRWAGEDGSTPVLLIGHTDVVPVEAETASLWKHPPFAGVVADGFVWGRGTMDDKASVLGLLEAAEFLLGEGFQPRRTVYFAFGHDEEVKGEEGARVIAARLAERGVKPDLVLDEGGAVVAGFLPGMDRPVATIGVAEKGYLSVELSVQSEGGHSSIPPPHTAVGILSAAVARLEQHPVPANLDAVVRGTLDHLGPELPLLARAVTANLWLFGPLVERTLARVPATNASIRTTTAATMFAAGVKENILPGTGRAVVNFRILPGDSVQSVLQHVRRVVDDPRVEVNPLPYPNEPSPVAPPDSEAFRVLHRTVRQIFPDAVVVPSLVLGATDARHYVSLTPNVYRFLPIRLLPDDVRRFHGIDERLAIEDYATAVRFYIQLLRNLAGPGSEDDAR